MVNNHNHRHYKSCEQLWVLSTVALRNSGRVALHPIRCSNWLHCNCSCCSIRHAVHSCVKHLTVHLIGFSRTKIKFCNYFGRVWQSVWHYVTCHVSPQYTGARNFIMSGYFFCTGHPIVFWNWKNDKLISFSQTRQSFIRMKQTINLLLSFNECLFF